jgi:NAD(P)-dependent dehydrogenase (short-subunit alcohol dehydrogenase family)
VADTSPTAHADALFDVNGRTYVVTGAASGIGLAIAETLLANGAQVHLIDRDADRLASIAAELQASGRRSSSSAVDVAHAQGLRRAVDAFVDRTGRLDGMFANAGISGGPGFGTPAGVSTGQLENQAVQDWQRVLDINLFGVVNSLQAAVRPMKRQGHGSIVITASIAGLQAEAFVSYAYALAKAATIQLTRQSALELAPHGIRVNAIAPGFIKTAIAGGRLHDATVEAALARSIPLGRLGLPREVQGVALLLASDAGTYLTGNVIPIDGGVLLGVPLPSATDIHKPQ